MVASDREKIEARVRTPRIRIIWAMAFVAFAALNFGAIRAMSDAQRALYTAQTMEQYQSSLHTHKVMETLEYGALPMANILTVGLLIGYLRRGSRRFLWGFEIFGVLALALFITIACRHMNDLVEPFLKLVLPFVKPSGPNFTTMGTMITYSTAVVMLVLPQIAIAVAGGFLTRIFRIS
jgi:hypothetical protein